VTRPLLVAAAEASGDRLAAELVRGLRAVVPDLAPRGLVGPRMRAAGVEVVAEADGLGVMGFVEALRVAPRARRVLAAAREELRLRPPRACVTVDAPSLLLRVAREARAARVPAIHVVAPQVWAWRPGRARRVAEDVDVLLCLLPFEPAWFTGRVRAVFVGHPAAAVAPRPVPAPGTPTIALCPGSRRAEVAALAPVFAEVARRVLRARPDAGFLVPVAPGVDPGPLRDLPRAVRVDGLAAVAGADAALVASGTATLELAALDVPMVVAYRVHPWVAAVARRLVEVPYVALPNVLAGRGVVPEHLQELDPAALARDLLGLVGVRGQVPRDLVASLKGEGAVGRMVDEVRSWL
jgi:lipid-A-disaccharide synthase